MDLTISSKAVLNNGVEMPYLGLGVFQSKLGKEAVNAVKWALEAGYRHIDTAAIYGNERSVGKGVAESGVPREEIFVTSKLWNDFFGYESGLKEFEGTMKKLKFDYLDLYLLHWPAPNRLDAWRALCELYDRGKIKAIGVSNFTRRHLDELLGDSGVVPAVNQIEFNPFQFPRELMEYSQDKGIQVEGYTPLVRGNKAENPTVTEVAQKHGKTWAQVLIRWSLQHEVVTIPKSANQQRIAENADVFDFALASEEMSAIDSLHEDLRFAWDPESFK